MSVPAKRDGELTHASFEKIDSSIKLANEYFQEKQLKISQKASPRKADFNARSLQLKKLYYAIKDQEQEIINALLRDFNRSPTETTVFEFLQLCNTILHIIDRLEQWMSYSKIKDRSPPFMFGRIVVEKIARGTVLIVGPFNFPFLLALAPVAYAIAAGNCVILKPSELVPSSAMLIERIVSNASLPTGLVQVIQGSASETERLVQSARLDLIFFTGSPKVGSLIAQEAAKSLTPCVLELGGKSPVFITQSFSVSRLKTALRRVFFSAFGNSGQICVSPDYVLVHESLYPEVVKVAKQVLHEFFPKIDESVEYSHMVNKNAFDGAFAKLLSTKGKRFNVAGQEPDESILFIPPTLVFDVDWKDSLMERENFAPILPFIKYSNLDKEIDQILQFCDTPLAQYIFSCSEQETQHILARVRSGDCIIGDTMIHVGIADAPFGGIGSSGHGSHGGIYGFNAFSHERTVFRQPFWMDIFLSMRYPPLTASKRKALAFATEKKPWFDRQGRNNFPLLQFIAVSGIILCLSIIVYYSYKV